MRLRTLIGLLAAIGIPGNAGAVDGVIEINQARAAAGGVSSGDAAGFPVTLSEANSYVLTSNLDVRGLPGDADLVAVEITAEDVSLDLNGFRIVGPAICSGAPGEITCSSGLGAGITGTARNSSVGGGSVTGFAAGGVFVGAEARVRDLRVADNGVVGLSVGDSSSVDHAMALGNDGPGISTGANSVVSASNASFNDGFGLDLGPGSGFSNSVISQNGAGAVRGGVELSANVCDGESCSIVCTDADSDGYATNCAPFDCDDDDDAVNPGETELCDSFDNNCNSIVDEGCLPPSEAIALARASSGAVSIPIGSIFGHPLVTYVRPAVGDDPAGFFLQADATGPALFVAVDPSTLSPSPAAGDEISLVVDEMAVVDGLPQATAVSVLIIHASGQPVGGLTQDVSAVSDLVSALDDYDSELISLSGTLTTDFTSAGLGHVNALLDTAGVTGGDLSLRIPSSLQSLLGGGTGCAIELTQTPLLRFNAEAQPHAWASSELTGTLCPDVTVNEAVAASATSVVVRFERDIDPGSVLGDGSQFSFTGGLTASAASVSGNEVTVTTSAQTPAAAYTVTVALTIQDTLGASVSASADSAGFTGWVQTAGVRINELNATLDYGCDLVELRVTSSGTLDGFQLFERNLSVLTFSDLDVVTNDYVIVHFDGNDVNCNPATAGNETSSKSEYPVSTHTRNFDTAYDWYTTDSGITDTTNVLTLVDPLGNIVDAVLLADDATGTAAADSETQAALLAAEGEWEQVGGGVPAGGFVDDDFRANAVLDLDATGTTVGGTSIQRGDDADTNTAAGWTDAGTASWGGNNSGQIDVPLPPSEAIALARGSVGAVSIAIGGVSSGPLVTYVRSAVGSDPAGFFLQADATGPALFVAVDPATLSPSPAVGDELSLVVDEMAVVSGLPQATAVSGLVVHASGQPVGGLTQDVSAASDLVSALDDYDSELISLSGTLTGDFALAGLGHVSASLDTAGVTGGSLSLRIPSSLQGLLGGGTGCAIQLTQTPLLRFNTAAQPHAWASSELAGTLCPDVTVNEAVAASATSVVVRFERDIDPGSVLGDGSQFSFTGGLTASAASVSGNEITVTTSAQTPDDAYTVTVALSVQDTLGASVSASADSAGFTGWAQTAGVRINELNATLDYGCDLVELRVTSNGTLDGFQLLERDVSVLTFSGLDVAKNDYVIVHFNGADITNCNPATAGNETSSKSEYPASTHTRNFDTAYDWYTADTGITATTNVLTLVDPLGNIVDAVLLADDATGTAAAASEAQAAVVAAEGEWEQVGGGIPAGGFVDADFRAHAVLDLDATATTVGGTSIQRNDDDDNNNEDDWTDVGTSTWSVNNSGQSDLTSPASAAITTARASVGTVSISIPNALVTYERPAVGIDPAGFFLQADATGPALFVAVDPSTLSPSPAVGDELSLVVDEMAVVSGLPQATAVSGLTVHASGQPVGGLTQDVSAVSDLVSALDDYDSELISLSGTLTADFTSAGLGHVNALLDTAGVTGGDLSLRIPSSLQNLLGGGTGCAIELTQTPLLRFNAEAQPHAWASSELAGSLCPDVTVNEAVAASATSVVVRFERDIDPGSVVSNGSQFSFSGGLTASAASVSGNEVTVTTSAQTPDDAYTVTVALTVEDTLGAPVSASADSAGFTGWVQTAGVRINELNANIDNGCDLVELRVTSNGTLDGFQLFERTGLILTFSGLDVATNDYVIVHFDTNDTNCNPASAENETSSKSEYPVSTHTRNFDTAYDWYITDSGITSTTNVLTLVDPVGNIVDAVLLADDASGLAASGSEDQAAVVAAEGEWEQVGGGVPAGGFVDDDFRAHAVLDLNATATTVGGTSIQRDDDADNNDEDDWTDAGTSTWSVNNSGQSNF